MNNLPKWAEKFFSLKCTEGHATCTPPEEDINGWDFLVELPARPYSGPAEMEPPASEAFVQIKSTTGARLRAGIKLSNMQKACRSKRPWFVFLIVGREHHTSKRSIYGVHLWGDLMGQAMAAVRRASLDDVPLNTRRLTVRFGSTDEVVGDLVAWMQSSIDAVGQDYEREKAQLSDTLGREEGFGKGLLTIEAASEDDIALTFLGLKRTKTTGFIYTPERFGIPDRRPLIDAGAGDVTITPQSTGTCEIRLRGPADQPSLILPGLIYPLVLPGLPEEKKRLRFSSPPMELVWRLGGTGKMFVSLDPKERYGVSQLEAYAKIRKWKKVDLQVWIAGKFVLSGRIELDSTGDAGREGILLPALETLMRLANIRDISGIRASIEDLNSSVLDLGYFQQVLAPGSMRFEFDATSNINTPAATSILYYASVTVSGWTFECLARRAVREDVVVDGKRRLTSVVGLPVLLEVYVNEKLSEDQRNRIEGDYLRVMQQDEDPLQNTLGFGDIIVIAKAQRAAALSEGGRPP